jgi:hypothetical protein
MKLKDCKKGTKVLVFDHVQGKWQGVIAEVYESSIYVVDPNNASNIMAWRRGIYYPEQLQEVETKTKKRIKK